MSDDDEGEYEYDEDDDDGDNIMEEENEFEYTDNEEEQDDVGVALENAYYNAKGLRDTDTSSIAEAAEAFEQVIVQEQEQLEKDNSKKKYGPWSYKAMKQLIKLHLRGKNNNLDHEVVMNQYRRLLDCISSTNSDVNPAAVEKGINTMLERIASLNNNTNNTISTGKSTSNTNITNNNNIIMHPGSDQGSRNNFNNSYQQQTLALAVYDATLAVFHPQTGPCKNERLWFRTNLKYGQLLYEMNETAQLQKVLKDLLYVHGGVDSSLLHSINSSNAAASSSSSASSTSASTNSLEIYALQIQLYSRQKDTKKLRETFQKAMNVRGGIPHPRTIALIQGKTSSFSESAAVSSDSFFSRVSRSIVLYCITLQCRSHAMHFVAELGGKMHMSHGEYEEAGKTFFQAFKSYDEAGDHSRLRCLKYLVLASMLHASTINPFDSQEARPYRDDPEIVVMTNLVSAFQNNEIQKFESILRRNQGRVMADEFIREHVEDLLRTIRTQVLRRLIRPYQRISLSAIAAALNDIPISVVENLLVSLILDSSVDGSIDLTALELVKRPERGMGQSSTAAAPMSTNDNIMSNSNSSTNSKACNRPKSAIVLQCEAMEKVTAMLNDLSAQITSTQGLPESSGGGSGMTTKSTMVVH